MPKQKDNKSEDKLIEQQYQRLKKVIDLLERGEYSSIRPNELNEMDKLKDSELHWCTLQCFKIEEEVVKLSNIINNIAILNEIKEYEQEIKSISNNVKKINTNKIKSSTEIDTKNKINIIKKRLELDVEKLNEKLDKKKRKIAQERESQEQQGVSSSSDQSPTKETGAVPKRKTRPPQHVRNQQNQEDKQEEILSKTQEGEQLQKEKEQRISKIKDLLSVRFEEAMHTTVFALFSDIMRIYNMKYGVDGEDEECMDDKSYKKFNNTLKSYIKNYYTSSISKFLLHNNHINIDWEKLSSTIKKLFESDFAKFKERFQNDFCQIRTQDDSGYYIKKLYKYKVSIPKFEIPNVENIQKVEDDLVNKNQDLLKKLKTQEKIEGEYIDVSDEKYKESLFEFLEKIMEKHGYQKGIDKVIEELTKQHSPNNKIEGASAEQDSACAQVREF